MRFESVKAHAFGPFRDKQLRFEPGMNVIYGPNEAGKSTWHSALFAGLCGQRRGRGRQQKSDRDFQERHEPWDDSSTWDVGAVVALDRGISVELRHDLTGSAPATARDAVIAGRDYANEIMYEGTPDGSRWLGLNRRSFPFLVSRVFVKRTFLAYSTMPTPCKRTCNAPPPQPVLTRLQRARSTCLLPFATNMLALIVHRQNRCRSQRRDWSFGPSAESRMAEGAHERSDFLNQDGSNLALVLSNFSGENKRLLVSALQKLYDGIVDISVG